MVWGVREGQRVRLVDDDVLRAWWRERMAHDPVWQNELRRRFREQAEETGIRAPGVSDLFPVR